MSLLKRSIKNVRSPRVIEVATDYFSQSVVDSFDKKRTAVENEKLSDILWNSCQREAEKALETEFIQGIKSGSLDPNDYGGYTVQDAVYCFNATNDYKIAHSKSSDVVMKNFLEGRINSYNEYTDEMFKQWHIKDPNGIRMGPAAASYSCFEKAVAENQDAIYLLVAMLPCEQLWAWLAEEIESGITDTNVYSFWIKDNLESSHHLQTFLDENAEIYGVNEKKAQHLYKMGMDGEVLFFSSAT